MSEKKYLGSDGLIRLVANLINQFANKEHTHPVDSELSSTSINPVQNQALKSKFDEVEAAIADKPDLSDLESGDIVVKESEHADSATTADSATNANHANTADSATSANTAASATKATQDVNGNVISETYQTIANATSQHNALQDSIDAKVNKTTTVNGKALYGNITLSADDVSAYSKSDIDSKVETLNTAINGKEASGTAANAVSSHNTNASAHNDIRDLISGLTNRLNAVANSTDTELDTLAEIVAYIKSNKSLIEEVTTKKVNVSDIINNLETNVTNKPLSAAQGVAIKSLIDALENSISSAQSKLDTIESGAQVNVNPDWNENDPSEDSYIANRPFYTGDPVLITVVDNVTFTTSDYNGLGSAQNPFALTLEEGIDYVVTWNGTDYTTTCTVMDGLLAIGNGSIFGMAGDTGEPFLIGYSGSIMLYATSIGSVTITIKRNDAEVHKINPKYIDMPNGAYVGESTGAGEIFNDYENNVASGSYSHAEGSYTEASGHWSHAEGYHAKAYGRWSHAEGYATKARGDAQHVQGKFNIEDTSKTYAHIVGNGISDNSLSNAHTLDWDGNAWYAGTVKVGGTSYSDASEIAKTQSSNDMLHNGNELTFIPSGYNGVVHINDKTADGSHGYVSTYYLRDGKGGLSELVVGDLQASNIKTDGSFRAGLLKTDNSEASIKISDNNELNFGAIGDTLYIGYENRTGSSGNVKNYCFGTHTGGDRAESGTIKCGMVVEGGTALSDKYVAKGQTEQWTFTLEDGSTVTKAVYVG